MRPLFLGHSTFVASESGFSALVERKGGREADFGLEQGIRLPVEQNTVLQGERYLQDYKDRIAATGFEKILKRVAIQFTVVIIG